MNEKVYVIILLNIMMKIRMDLFYKYEHENKIKLFSHNKIKFQARS